MRFQLKASIFLVGERQAEQRNGERPQNDRLLDANRQDQRPPHRFRDTFAVELLLCGEDIRTVQLLLGHTSLRTTERHYSPFVSAFQQRLDRATAKLKFG